MSRIVESLYRASGINLHEALDINLNDIATEILNEINDDNVDYDCRFKDGEARATRQGNIVIDWVTQLSVYPYEMRKEVKRAAREVKKRHNIVEPIKITIRMCTRDHWGDWLLSRIVV